MPRCTKLFVSQIPKALQFNDKFCPLNEVQTLLCWLNAHHCCLPFASHCAQFPPLPMNGINLRVFFWLEFIMVSCRNTRFFRQNTDKTPGVHNFSRCQVSNSLDETWSPDTWIRRKAVKLLQQHGRLLGPWRVDPKLLGKECIYCDCKC